MNAKAPLFSFYLSLSYIVHRGVLYYHSIPSYFTILFSLYSEAAPCIV